MRREINNPAPPPHEQMLWSAKSRRSPKRLTSRITIEEGMEKGIKKGRLEERRETARRLQQMGLSTEQIIEVTGVSPKEL